MYALFARRSRDDRGFTLIELLVVMIIIGVLAAVAIPIFLNQQKTAKDSTLISDTKNVAIQVTTWFGEDGGKDVDDLLAVTGKTGNIVLAAYGKGVTPTTPDTAWNYYPTLGKVTASDGNQITISVNAVTGSGSYRHPAGEFCLSSNNPSSHYNYSSPGATGAGNYDKLVYYDVALGGIVTMNDIVAGIQNGGDMPSCAHFGTRYMTAKGIPLT